MSYNAENLAKIREIYETKHLKAESEADEKRLELQMKIPGLRDIDRRLSKTGPRLMAVALRKSGETVESIQADVTALREKRDSLLAEYGYAADYTDPEYECPVCRDSGYNGLRMCTCMKRDLILAGYESAGVGKLVRSCTFENFSTDYYRDSPGIHDLMVHAYETIRNYAHGFTPENSPNLLLMGNTGLGKTHLSAAAAKVIIERGYDVVYTGAVGMIADFESEKFGRNDPGSSGNSTSRYFDCELLIIDDLGTEAVNQYSSGWIYEIINRRINTGKPVIISCNLTLKEIGQRYTDRITSRLIGEYLPVLFEGTDVRQQKLYANN